MTKPGIILCSRLGSSRVKDKPLKLFNGTPLIEHLIKRLLKTGIDVYCAIPDTDINQYNYLQEKYGPKFHFYVGQNDDPLARVNSCLSLFNLDPIVRICHDKMFVDPDSLVEAMKCYIESKTEYLYSSHLTPGSGFEIISAKSISEASKKYKIVEHISYAVRAITKNMIDFIPDSKLVTEHRLLVDYPEDVQVLETILSKNGNDCSLRNALKFLNKNDWCSRLNRLPELTIYTCAYNAEKWIQACMGSVSKQKDFHKYEYIIIDDFSNDDTYYLASKFSALYSNVRVIRNQRNMGLASSSNIALIEARGKYIMRLDADDYLPWNMALNKMVDEIESSKSDAVYPDNYFGSISKIQNGSDNHHVGGTIFSKRAINHIKFTDGLRSHDSLDVFNRSKDQLNIKYLHKPMFFYRQRKDSLSKTNLEYREKVHAQVSGN